MKDDIIIIIGFIASVVLTFMIGIAIGEYRVYNTLQENEKYIKKYDGLRFEYNNSHQLALQYAKEYDEYGDWVCSNVKGMSFNRCVEVAQHECAHEIWAEICEKNDELCQKGQELLNNYSNNENDR